MLEILYIHIHTNVIHTYIHIFTLAQTLVCRIAQTYTYKIYANNLRTLAVNTAYFYLTKKTFTKERTISGK